MWSLGLKVGGSMWGLGFKIRSSMWEMGIISGSVGGLGQLRV